MIILTTARINNYLVFCVSCIGKADGRGIHSFFHFFSHKLINTPIVHRLEIMRHLFYRTQGIITLGDLI